MREILELLYQIFIVGCLFFQILLFIAAIFGKLKPRQTPSKPNNEPDLNFCRKCQKVCAIEADFKCAGCGENICLYCGCTESIECEKGCTWIRPGVCSKCVGNENSLDERLEFARRHGE